jgi:hypothetical protein
MGSSERAWTETELRRALAEWEKHLRENGRTELTIRTYVRDASAFIDSLVFRQGQRSTPARKPRWVVEAPTLPTPGSPVSSAPDELRRLHTAWVAAGRPAQGPIDWPRERWLAMLPEHSALLSSLPDRVSRITARRVTKHATRSEEDAVNALLAVVTWGFGNVGNGPWRAREMLTCRPDSAARLLQVANVLDRDGPIAAYQLLRSECKLKWLGPAYGTKFLALVQRGGARPAALIHDDLVRGWLAQHGRPDLSVDAYRPPMYAAYLDQMQLWANELGAEPESVEWLIFQSRSDERGNQWAARR